jgi:hypothetical protein
MKRLLHAQVPSNGLPASYSTRRISRATVHVVLCRFHFFGRRVSQDIAADFVLYFPPASRAVRFNNAV